MPADNNEDVLTIPLKGELLAKISPEDAILTGFKYSPVNNGYRTYVVRSEKGNNRVKHYLSRDVMEAKLGRPLIKGEIVIFLDHDTMNYTRANLELKTPNNRKTEKQ